MTVSSVDCGRRLGLGSEVAEAIQSTKSLVKIIEEGLAYTNGEIEGVVFTADAIPFVNSSTFSFGVNVHLKADIKQTAEDVIDIVSDFIGMYTPYTNTTKFKMSQFLITIA